MSNSAPVAWWHNASPRLESFAGTRPGQALLVGMLAITASNAGQAGLGAPVLLALLVGAWLSGRVALTLLFAATFLPSIKGLPFSPTFLTAGALMPWLVIHRAEVVRAPRRPLVVALALLALAVATYPMGKSIGTLVLAVALIAFIETLVIMRDRPPEDGLACLAVGGLGTFLIPFVMNAFLATSSPFLGELNAMWLLGGRVTFGVYEANMASAFLAAALAAWTWGAGQAAFGRRAGGIAVVGFALFLLLAVSGSRAALVVGILAVVLAVVMGHGPGFRRIDAASRQSAGWLLLAVGALVLIATIVNPDLLSGVSRLATSDAADETMRVNNLGAGLNYLNRLPWFGMDPSDYLKVVYPMHPHNALLAGIAFVGLLTFVPVMALLWIPILDVMGGGRWSPSLALSAALVTLTLVQQTIPFPLDQGVFILTALWYAGAARPRVRTGTLEPI